MVSPPRVTPVPAFTIDPLWGLASLIPVATGRERPVKAVEEIYVQVMRSLSLLARSRDEDDILGLAAGGSFQGLRCAPHQAFRDPP